VNDENEKYAMIARVISDDGSNGSEWTPELVRKIGADRSTARKPATRGVDPAFAVFALDLHGRAAGRTLSEVEQDEVLAELLREWFSAPGHPSGIGKASRGWLNGFFTYGPDADELMEVKRWEGERTTLGDGLSQAAHRLLRRAYPGQQSLHRRQERSVSNAPRSDAVPKIRAVVKRLRKLPLTQR
jgi:hypothetical protein